MHDLAAPARYLLLLLRLEAILLQTADFVQGNAWSCASRTRQTCLTACQAVLSSLPGPSPPPCSLVQHHEAMHSATVSVPCCNTFDPKRTYR